jgi:hypothetical protein
MAAKNGQVKSAFPFSLVRELSNNPRTVGEGSGFMVLIVFVKMLSL